MVFELLKRRMASANPPQKGVGNLTLDKAAFLLIRIKRIFVKKKNKGRSHLEKVPSKKKPPLLRARTLPAIICPSLNIIQAQLEADSASRNIDSDGQGCSEFKTRRHFSGSSVAKTKTQERERCYLDPDFEPAKSPLGSPRASVTSVTSCASTLSTQSGGKESSKQMYEITKAGLARFAKRLTSKDKSSNSKVVLQFPSAIPNIEVTPLRRSGSVDSLLDSNLYPIDGSDISNCSSMACLAPSGSSYNLLSPPSGSSPCPTRNNSLTVPGDGRTLPTSPSVPAKLEAHRRGDIPSSPSVPNRLTKGLSGQCLENPEVLLEGLPLSKTERKRLEKLNKINIDLQALFVSVEHEHLERVRSILSTTDVNVNCVNSDGFTPLDIAVMILDISMAKLLQAYGAKESPRFRSRESKFSQLLTLVKEAERCVDDLTTCVLSAATSGSLSMALLKEKEKQLTLWRRRQTLLWRMKAGFEKIKPPEAPASVTLDVVGTKALKVKFTEADSAREAETVVTKYKVEWSVRPDFHPLSGSRDMMNLQKLEMVLAELIHGVPYYVRVAAGNCKGFSAYTSAIPPTLAPSSWMDIQGKKSRSVGRLCQLECVFHQIKYSRPPCSSEIKDSIFGTALETPQQQRRQVRKSIKNLFTPTPKFQKYMKRGIYLACLMYTDHRVLVTTEDTLPIMEVDETCPSYLHNDFHWLMKIACTWEDSKSLRMEMEKTQSSSALHFRMKLLQAAEMMQSALGIQDLGQFYYKPIKDLDDTTVLCTVKHVPDSKSLNNLSIRWVPLAKLQRKLSINSETSHDVYTVNSLLLSATQAMMAYNHMSRIPLPRGLYVAYVKTSCTYDLINILVPKKAPNVLPYYKVRENPHVSADEWSWLKSLSSVENGNPSANQLRFQKVLSAATKNLLTLLEVMPDQSGEQSRLYDREVIELNAEVSLILLLPPVDAVTAAPGQKDDVTERTDCVLLPLQIFEMIHMSTYQHTFISRYSRISSILEMDTLVAQHVLRQAFSTPELASANSRLRQLKQFQAQVDNTWGAMRWLIDAINLARDKHSPTGILLNRVLVDEAVSPSSSPPQSPQHCQSLHTLQVPTEVLGLRSFPSPTPPVSIRITNSSSSFSLTETKNNTEEAPKPNSEMRRCASTSRLMTATASTDESDLDAFPVKNPPCTLQIMNEASKAYSSEALSVTFKIEPCTLLSCSDASPVDENDDPTEKLQLEDPPSNDGIVIHVLSRADSERSASSGEDATNPEMDDLEDDISDYKEQKMDELLLLPHDDSRDRQSDDEDSLTDCGLQFKIIPVSNCDDASEADKAFVASLMETEDATSNSDCSENELRVRLATFPDCSSIPCVRLELCPDVTAREIIEAVISQVNESSGDECAMDPSGNDLRLVVCFGSRERYLSDSFQPLKVQNPWTKGQLLVKPKDGCTMLTEE